MSQPFVISMKLNGDSLNAVAAIRATKVELDTLKRTTIDTATGSTAAQAAYVSTLQREQAAIDVVTTATHANTVAIAANDNALRRANAQRTNLLFQLQDVGVSLSSGMNPLMVAAQQGSQISMIYGPEEGGLGRALAETAKLAGGLVTKLWPIGLAVGAGSLAIAGMRNEIEQTSGKAVSFGDVFLGVFQTIGDWLSSTFKPQIDAIGGWFGSVWDWVTEQTKRFINFVTNSMADTVTVIGALWNGLPAAIADIGIVMANTIVSAFEGAINKAAGLLNLFIKESNKTLHTSFDPIDKVNLPKFENRFAGAKDALGAALNAPSSNHDYAGDFFGAVQQHAIENYNAGLDATAKAGKAAALGIRSAKDAVADFNKELDFYRETFGSIFTDINAGLKDNMTWWDAVGNAGANALDKIADRALGMAADGIFDMIVGAIFGGSGGVMGSIAGGVFSPSVGDPWSGLRGYASGTDNFPGGFARMNENGRGEIVKLPSGSTIIPHDVSKSMAGQLSVSLSSLAGLGGATNGVVAGSSPITFAPVCHFTGSGFTEAQAKRLMDDNNRELMRTIPAALSDANRRAVRGT